MMPCSLKAGVPGTIYLIHFDEGLPQRPGVLTRHYIGWTADLEQRLAQHRAGRGSALMAEITRRGIGWQLVRTWSGDRHLERWIKEQKAGPRFCPTCAAATGRRVRITSIEGV